MRTLSIAMALVALMIGTLCLAPARTQPREQYVAGGSYKDYKEYPPGCASSELSDLSGVDRDVVLSIKPLQTAEPDRSAQRRNAYHYDDQYRTWSADVARARARLVSDVTLIEAGTIEAGTIAAESSWMPIAPTAVPARGLAELGERLLRALDRSHTHESVFTIATSSWRSLQTFDAFAVRFAYCMHAPGKSHGLCARGTAVLRRGDVRVIDLRPAGVVTESDISLYRS